MTAESLWNAARIANGSIAPVTTTLNYGTFRPDGSIDVRLTYDHRVLDGVKVARTLVALEEVLHGCILEELSTEPAPLSESQLPHIAAPVS